MLGMTVGLNKTLRSFCWTSVQWWLCWLRNDVLILFCFHSIIIVLHFSLFHFGYVGIQHVKSIIFNQLYQVVTTSLSICQVTSLLCSMLNIQTQNGLSLILIVLVLFAPSFCSYTSRVHEIDGNCNYYRRKYSSYIIPSMLKCVSISAIKHSCMWNTRSVLKYATSDRILCIPTQR